MMKCQGTSSHGGMTFNTRAGHTDSAGWVPVFVDGKRIAITILLHCGTRECKHSRSPTPLHPTLRDSRPILDKRYGTQEEPSRPRRKQGKKGEHRGRGNLGYLRPMF